MDQRKFFISLYTAICLSFAMLFILASPKKQSTELQVDKVPLIKADDLKSRLQDAGKEFILLDTRSVEEYRSGHLKNAHFVNFETFQLKDVEDISKDKEIVVYCLSGGRSNRVATQLLDAGYKRVQNLEGGIRNWKEKGYPVVYE